MLKFINEYGEAFIISKYEVVHTEIDTIEIYLYERREDDQFYQIDFQEFVTFTEFEKFLKELRKNHHLLYGNS
jgi:hypothetical protein